MTEAQREGSVDWTELERLWETAHALSAAERRLFLETSGADGALRAEVNALCSRHEPAMEFFDRLRTVLPDAAGVAMGGDAIGASAPDSLLPDDADPLLGTTIGHYEIEARLGEGGMGIVYRALDTRLQRTVALKFLPSRLSADAISRVRFRVEARAAAALDHPNICTVHEIGGDDGERTFIAMAFYAGETLEQVLKRGPVPLPLALDYATQIARGLSAAHESGITHRDVKPGNVVITAEGVVKLLDFGIARVPHEDDLARGAPGTVAYMSPEQLAPGHVDSRADLWSLGVVLFEMCVGTRPFAGSTYSAIARAILDEPAPPLSAAKPDAPPQVGRLVARLLTKDREMRYASADNLIADLESASREEAQPRAQRSMVHRGPRRRRAILVAATLAATGWLLWSLLSPQEPLRILVADAEGDTLIGHRVSQLLRERLASPDLGVIGRPSIADALIRMGHAPDVRLRSDIARQLAIREGLGGYVHVTVDRIGKRFTLAAILIEPTSGDLIDHYETTVLDTAELAAATDRLAVGIRRALGRASPARRLAQPLLALTTDSTSALRRHIEGVQANRDGDYERGIELLAEAIGIDPSLADAYQASAFSLEQIGRRAGRAQSFVMRAGELRNRLAPHERYSVEADVAWQVDGDLGEAIVALRRADQAAQALQPGRILNRRSIGLALMLRGDLTEAEDVLEIGRQFATCPGTTAHLVTLLHALDRDDEAKVVLGDAVAQWPTNPWLRMEEAHYLARAGDYRGAHRAVRRLRSGYNHPFALRAEAVFDAVEGRIDEASQHLRELRDDRLRRGMLAPALEAAAALGRLRLLAGDTLGARREVEDVLGAHPLESIASAERPYLSLALFFADTRDARRARQMLADYDTLVDSAFKGPDRWMVGRTRAALLLAADSAALALETLKHAALTDRIWSEWLDNVLITPAQRPELARAYDRLGLVDSAIVVYTRYLDARVLYRAEMDAFHLAPTLARLAELHARKGELQTAAGYRARLKHVWRDADEPLKIAWGLDQVASSVTDASPR